MLIAGVDENGLGPGLGPLIVTAVSLEVPGMGADAARLDRLGLPVTITDSKKVFRRSPSSYAAGEAAALALLEMAGQARQDLRSSIDTLTRGAADWGAGSDSAQDLHVSDLPLPIWSGRPAPLVAALERAGIRVHDVACRVLLPGGFNRDRVAAGGKFALDYRLFEEALGLLRECPSLALLGKIGSARRYEPWLIRSGRIDRVETRVESPEESRYQVRFQGRPIELRFVRDGDSLYLPIAAASLIGKYLREAMMLHLNLALGFDSPIPHASGYWSDPKTFEAIARFGERHGAAIPRTLFVREG